MRYRVTIPTILVQRVSGSFKSNQSMGFQFPEEPVQLFGVEFSREVTPPRVAKATVDCAASDVSTAADNANRAVEQALHFISLKSGIGMATSRFEAEVEELPDAPATTDAGDVNRFAEVFDTLQVRDRVVFTNSPLPQWFKDLEAAIPGDPEKHRRLLRALELFYRGLTTLNPVPQFLCFFVTLEMLVPPVEPWLPKDQTEEVVAAAVGIKGLSDDVREQLRRHLSGSLGHFGEVPKKEAWLNHLRQYWQPLTLDEVSELITARNNLAHGRDISDPDRFLHLSDLVRWVVGQIFKKELGLQHVDWLV